MRVISESAVRPALVAFTIPWLAASAGCGAAVTRLGPAPSQAAVHIDGLLGSLAARFGAVELDPSFAAARPKFAKGALAPSRVFADPSLWTQSHVGTREAELLGHRSGGRYRLGFQPAAAAPAEPGAYRACLGLAQKGEHEYEWTMREELAVGQVAGDELARAASGLLRSAETLSEAEARLRLNRELPRSSAALGRLFSLDALRLVPSGAGSAVSVVVSLHPEWLEPSAPHYARFLGRYVPSTRLNVAAWDEGGRRWWSIGAAGSRIELQLRVKNGRLAPLSGALGTLPDRLRVRLDYSGTLGGFRVGLSGLEGDVALTRTPREKAFVARFRRPPQWELPVLVGPLLRSTLRRPFESDGAMLLYSIRDTPGSATLVAHEYRVAVKESWIVRWLGGLLSQTVSDFRERAESEADRFIGECLLALRDDLVELVQSRGHSEREGLDAGVEIVAVGPLHAIAPVHRADRRRQRAEARVLEGLAGYQEGLVAHHSGAEHALHAAFAVGDDPLAADELGGLVPDVRDADRIGEQVLAALRRAALRQVHALHLHPDSVCGGVAHGCGDATTVAAGGGSGGAGLPGSGAAAR